MSDIKEHSKIKASFLSKISHELKSPIHGIMSLADYLERNWDAIDSDTAKTCITEINKASHSLNFLIDTLFNLSKIRDNEIQFDLSKIEFDAVVREAMQIVGIFTTHNDKIHIDYKNDAVGKDIIADKIWFKQLLTNLLINSIKFTQEGHITIRVSNINYSNKNYFKFAVSDEGIGIPEDELKSIFQAFNKGSAQSDKIENNGLGLAICQEIIRAHNGNIFIYNNWSGCWCIYSWLYSC